MAAKQYKKRKYATKAVRKQKGKLSYADAHNFKFMNPTTGICNSANVPASFGNGNYIKVVDNVSGVSSFAGTFQFSAGQVPQLSAMCPYFDRYKVNKISVKVIPENNMASPVGNGILPVMKIIHDYDDNTTTTANTAQIWARRGKVHRLDKPFTVSFVPRVIYNGQQVGANVPVPVLIQKCPWLNCSPTGQQIWLYGLKFAVRDWYASGIMVCRFEITYSVSFKEQLNYGLTQNISDFGIPLVSQLPDQRYVDGQGNVWDNPEFTGVPLLVADLSGNLSEYVPPPV